MIKWRALFLLLMPMFWMIGPVYMGGSCPNVGFPPLPEDACSSQNYSTLSTPPLRNLTDMSGNPIFDCGITVMLDLDQRFTTSDDYSNILMFLKDMVFEFMDRGVGSNVLFMSMFDQQINSSCCDRRSCETAIGWMAYSDYVGTYSSTATVQPETSEANFTIALTSGLKTMSNNPCLYNTAVMVSSRIFEASEWAEKEVMLVGNSSCVSFTSISVGNPNITSETVFQFYGQLTPYQFVSRDYNCLPALATCIKPCGPDKASSCQEYQDADYCPAPTTPVLTTTQSTTESLIYEDYWHLIYLFALSNRTTEEEFQDAIQYVQIPLQDCVDDNVKIVVRFLARDNSDSGWLTEINAIHEHLESLNADEVLLDATHTVDTNDPYTLQLVQRAVALPVTEGKGVGEPRIMLLTDFVSETFIHAYNTNQDDLQKEMIKFDFEIYCFDEEAEEIYKNETIINGRNIHADANFSYSPDVLVPLCNKPPDNKASVPTIMIIIIGTCTGAMALLIIATVLYRQKYMWSEKLNRFKSNQTRGDEEGDDIIDYWELSWEKLVVKNEKLGHGAYGQVYKGKLIGPSPAIEHYHRAEVTNFTDCDCAVKMLPKYAAENARTEFMHEIHLMKTLGLHDNIVNMLGCITTGKCCLVLEYCANRDLLRYLKHKKAELEISKSIDDQVEFNKELLHLAWQVAKGMRFLQERNIIHRDLAARNILISGLDGMKSAKIGDFGLAMVASPTENALSATGRLPIKWLALESLLKEQFSFKSDVWSFGIVLFEMYSMGEIPFADIEPTDLVKHLEAGNRPKPPLLAPEKIKEVMMQCWDKNPELRPSFSDILNTFTTLLEQATEGYGYLALLKTAESIRVVSEVTENGVYENPIDQYYADEPIRPRAISMSTSSKLSNQSRILLTETIKNGKPPPRKRAVTLQQSSVDSVDSTEETVPVSVEPFAGRWRERIRRRRSQLAALNPIRKIREIARSASPSERRGSDPTS